MRRHFLVLLGLALGCDGVTQAPRVEDFAGDGNISAQDGDQVSKTGQDPASEASAKEKKETVVKEPETTADRPIVFKLNKLYLQSSQILQLTIDTTDAFRGAKWSLNDLNTGTEYFSGVEFTINQNVGLGLVDSTKFQLHLDIAADNFPLIKNRLLMLLEKNGRSNSYETPEFEVQDFAAFYSSGLGEAANTAGWFLPIATVAPSAELQPVSGQVFFAQ